MKYAADGCARAGLEEVLLETRLGVDLRVLLETRLGVDLRRTGGDRDVRWLMSPTNAFCSRGPLRSEEGNTVP
jgi:hypothetical protein